MCRGSSRRIIMAISEAMLAQALLEFFRQQAKEFEEFLLERYNIDNGDVTWSEDRKNRRLLLTVTTRAQDDQPVSEYEYNLRIERADRTRK
jgi:hypothetical protein